MPNPQYFGVHGRTTIAAPLSPALLLLSLALHIHTPPHCGEASEAPRFTSFLRARADE